MNTTHQLPEPAVSQRTKAAHFYRVCKWKTHFHTRRRRRRESKVKRGSAADLIPNNLQIVFSFYHHWAVMCARLIVCQTQLFGGRERGVDIKKRKSDWLVKRTCGGDDGISGGNQAYISHASQAAHSLCSKRALCNQKVSCRSPAARPHHHQRWKKRAPGPRLFFIFHLSLRPPRYRSRQLCCLPHTYTRMSVCVTFCAMCEYPVAAAAKKRKDRRSFWAVPKYSRRSRAPDSCQLLLECERAGPICRRCNRRVSMLARCCTRDWPALRAADFAALRSCLLLFASLICAKEPTIAKLLVLSFIVSDERCILNDEVELTLVIALGTVNSCAWKYKQK